MDLHLKNTCSDNVFMGFLSMLNPSQASFVLCVLTTFYLGQIVENFRFNLVPCILDFVGQQGGNAISAQCNPTNSPHI